MLRENVEVLLQDRV